jgi:hypothetical protein
MVKAQAWDLLVLLIGVVAPVIVLAFLFWHFLF